MSVRKILLLVALLASADVAVAAAGTKFKVPSDPRASYTLLSATRGKGGHVFAVSRRDGPSGTRFSRREIDCRLTTFRYTGEGDTLAQAQRPHADPGAMAPLVAGSISDVASRFACSKVGR